MIVDLENAKKRLINGEYTCVICKGNEEFCSKMRGVKPLLDFLASGKDFAGFSAADKTVGAGAAHIYVLLGVKNVWARVISVHGREILEENGIEACFEEEVPYIVNRTGDGMCPIEKCVGDTKNSTDALCKIRQTLEELRKNC